MTNKQLSLSNSTPAPCFVPCPYPKIPHSLTASFIRRFHVSIFQSIFTRSFTCLPVWRFVFPNKLPFTSYSSILLLVFFYPSFYASVSIPIHFSIHLYYAAEDSCFVSNLSFTFHSSILLLVSLCPVLWFPCNFHSLHHSFLLSSWIFMFPTSLLTHSLTPLHLFHVRLCNLRRCMDENIKKTGVEGARTLC